jgi:hypothetical protein
MSINKVTKGQAGVGALALAGLQLQTLRFALQPTTSTTFVSAGVLPARCVVLDAFIDMASVASAATPLLDVGTGAATTGFLNGISVGTTGLLHGSLVAGARTVGALLSVDSSGSSSFVPSPAIIATATTVGYTTRSVAARLGGEVVLLIAKL